MEKENWRKALAASLVSLRKQNNITQTELGEKLNYSDKSISKWERGEGAPDLNVMVQLSDMYGVSIDEMLGRAKTQDDKSKGAMPLVRHAAVLITMCSIVLLSALAVFVALNLFLSSPGKSWLCFLAALPVMFSAMGIMFLVWKDYAWAFGTLSIALWTTCLFIQQLTSLKHAGFIYAVGGIIQLIALAVCGFIIMRKAK